ncbi:MAG: hypothetical protein ACRCXZ_09385 [Patescibacteria group bacterium]
MIRLEEVNILSVNPLYKQIELQGLVSTKPFEMTLYLKEVDSESVSALCLSILENDGFKVLIYLIANNHTNLHNWRYDVVYFCENNFFINLVTSLSVSPLLVDRSNALTRINAIDLLSFLKENKISFHFSY